MIAAKDRGIPVYPIRTVSKLTGVSEGSLRAWEARYGLLAPARTTGGHRLYSDEDVRLVMRVKRLLHEDGMSMAGIRGMLNGGLEAGNG
jgi:DNA-binding transcriptional MerR regulator